MRILLLAALAVGCGGRSSSPLSLVERPSEVRRLPGDAPSEDGAMLVSVVPRAGWDRNLARAVDTLLLAHASKGRHLSPKALSAAAARAGYPGQARFARAVNTGAFPHALVEELVLAANGERVDVALSRRKWADGTTLWLLGWAPRRAELDPIPLRVELDDPVPVRVDLPDGTKEARLFVALPSGGVEELRLSDGRAQWIDLFHEPGVYRFEVVAQRGPQTEVVLLWSHVVESELPPVRLPPLEALAPPNPHAAEQELWQLLNQRRGEQGLRPVQPFSLFEPLAREHSAYMASTGVLAHVLPGVTPGVPVRAARLANPDARHYENVAAAMTARDALELVWDSPGHRRQLLCEACTHAAIGVALEPALHRRPRLYVTWELLAFPQGPPSSIDFNR